MPRILLLFLLVAALVSSGCRSGRIHCVSGDSMVDTPAGPVRAEEIRVGDLVSTRQPDGSLGIGRVIAAWHAMAGDLLTITISDGRTLQVTQEHPIGVPGADFVPAGQLIVGGAVRTGDADADIVSIEPRRGRQRVVDLTIQPDENFFANGVLVHNKRDLPRPPKPIMPGRYVNIQSGATIELTATGGRLFIPRPGVEGRFPPGDSVWEIGPWTLNDYTLTASLARKHARDWMTWAVSPESSATLVIRAVGTRYPSTLPDAPPSETVIQSVRIESPRGNHDLGSAWTTPAAIERALRGFEPDSP